MTRELRITRFATGEVVKRLDVTGRSDREVAKIETGATRNMDLESFCIVDTKDTQIAADWERTWAEHLAMVDELRVGPRFVDSPPSGSNDGKTTP